MIPQWLDLAQLVDTAVDDVWGERVSLLPYVNPGMSASYPDTSRTAQLNTIGVEMSMRTTVGQVGAMASKTIEADLLISMRKEPVEACRLTKGDRVRMEDRAGEVLEVGHVEPDVSDRPIIHLLRIKE